MKKEGNPFWCQFWKGKGGFYYKRGQMGGCNLPVYKWLLRQQLKLALIQEMEKKEKYMSDL